MKLNKGVNSVNIKYGTTSAQECVYKSVRRRMPCPKTPFSSCPEEFYVSFCLSEQSFGNCWPEVDTACCLVNMSVKQRTELGIFVSDRQSIFCVNRWSIPSSSSPSLHSIMLKVLS